MPKELCSEDEFIELWTKLGSPTLVQQRLGCDIREIYKRRVRIEKRRGIRLSTTNDMSSRATHKKHAGRIDLEIQNGQVIVFSDAHYWPGVSSTAHRALLQMLGTSKQVAVICNGDAFDGGQISRFPRIGWDEKPSVADELKCVTERLGEIEKAASTSRLIWNLGNHDARYETFLASKVPEFQGVDGFTLKSHFPLWAPAWATWINNTVVVKHRWHNGIHANYNNTLKSGVSLVAGHLHRLSVTPFSDYRGRRYGVDTGTLADPYDSQFIDYTEANPVNWCSGFVVLTFWNGQLLQPELVEVIEEGKISFRGQVIEV